MDEAAVDTKQELEDLDRVNGIIATVDGVAKLLKGGQSLVEGMSTQRLAELDVALKEIESSAQDLRKEVVEHLLDERVSIDETVGEITRRVGHSKYVYDDDAAIEALRDRGVDPIEAMKVNAKKFEEAAIKADLDPDDYIGRTEYTYYRRDK